LSFLFVLLDLRSTALGKGKNLMRKFDF
jgi:hypothetical protein